METNLDDVICIINPRFNSTRYKLLLFSNFDLFMHRGGSHAETMHY